jgi:hypothetical protein
MSQAIKFTQENNLSYTLKILSLDRDSLRTATLKFTAKILTTFSKFLVSLEIPFKDIKLSENMLFDIRSM